jgi:transcriptional regulator with XRE-family HTH domain
MSNALRKHLDSNRGRAAQLADEIGISRSYLSDLSHGKKTASLAVLQKIAAATAIPISELLGEQGFSEGSVAAYDPGPKANSLRDAIATLLPDIRHPTWYVASGPSRDFGVLAGDMVVLEAMFDPAKVANDALVVAQIVDPIGLATTMLCRFAAPWLIGVGGRIAGKIEVNASIVGIVRLVVRGQELTESLG